MRDVRDMKQLQEEGPGSNPENEIKKVCCIKVVKIYMALKYNNL